MRAKLLVRTERAANTEPMRTAIIGSIFLGLAIPCSADEIKLKDGTKIIGNIVGYEKDSFKVETSYGFALVRKDKVETITVSEAPKKGDAAKPEEKKEAQQASAPSPAAAAPIRNAPPAEPVIRESVDGTTYTNQTYSFRMYKPPSWRLIEGARKMLPAAVVAFGTSDESTLLVVGRVPARGTLDSQLSATERELRSIYENYSPAEPERTVIAGQPAIQRRFRGTADEREWSGMLIVLGRGPESFTILGMTHSESDLIQIQENVIARAVASLEFFQ